MSDIERAVAAHRAGDLIEAERLYRAVLAAAADHGEALHLLGVVMAQRGNFPEADRLMARAIAIMPDLAEVYAHRARVLCQLRRLDEALALCARALMRDSRDIEALNVRGNVHLETGRFADALTSYDQALAVEAGQPEVWNNRGIALLRLGRGDDSLASFDKALALAPGYFEAWSNRGNALLEMRRTAEALDSYDRSLAFRTDNAEAWNNRGNALRELGRFTESLASHGRALGLRPDWPEALANAANALCELDRYDEALAACEKALRLKPNYPEALNTQGNALLETNRIADALASFTAAQAQKPDYAVAHLNEGICRLLSGDLARGWEQYEWRWQGRNPGRGFAQPQWNGKQSIAGKTILLHAEQGFGDTIQFARYARLVAERGATTVLEVQPSLKTLLAGLAGVGAIVARGESLPSFDLHCPLLSLPRAFATELDSIPAETSYLRPPAAALTKWQSRVGALAGTKVGLVWTGSKGHKNDHRRSIPLARLLAPFTGTGVALVSLQKEIGAEDRALIARDGSLRHWGDDIADFADTAALVSLMDVVVTVDTSVAHLAGALGKPVWILLPFAPDWRWMLQREDSPWYPTARLFRQSSLGDWDGVIAAVARRLSELGTSVSP